MSKTDNLNGDSLRAAVNRALNIADKVGETLIAAKLSDILELIDRPAS